jgi:hypothetical protein
MSIAATEAGRIERPGRGRLLAQIAGALVVGTALTVLFVLPAEYGVDPTGIGTTLGLTKISAPAEVLIETKVSAPPEIARVEPVQFRTDEITITIPPFFESFGAIEYKVTMNEGQTLVYSWSSRDPILYEFHGHTKATPDKPTVEVMDYIKGNSAGENGTLTAPIDGIHGWYFAQSGMEPLEVTLRLAGYYTLEPGVLPIRPPQ